MTGRSGTGSKPDRCVHRAAAVSLPAPALANNRLRANLPLFFPKDNQPSAPGFLGDGIARDIVSIEAARDEVKMNID